MRSWRSPGSAFHLSVWVVTGDCLQSRSLILGRQMVEGCQAEIFFCTIEPLTDSCSSLLLTCKLQCSCVVYISLTFHCDCYSNPQAMLLHRSASVPHLADLVRFSSVSTQWQLRGLSGVTDCQQTDKDCFRWSVLLGMDCFSELFQKYNKNNCYSLLFNLSNLQDIFSLLGLKVNLVSIY